MEKRIFRIKEVDGDTSFQDVTLQIVDASIKENHKGTNIVITNEKQT